MTPAPSPAIDPHSFAQGPALPHLTLALAVNFASQTLAGSATWQLATPPAEPTEVVFDTRDLVIERVWTNAEGTGPEAAHTLGTPDATLRQALRIALPAGTAAVRIAYRTSPHAAALRWLAPAQTAGEHPFLFTQSQAILARTWLPCPDSPGRRFTYEAEVEILGEEKGQLLALMSAENPQATAPDGRYHFRQPQPTCWRWPRAASTLPRSAGAPESTPSPRPYPAPRTGSGSWTAWCKPPNNCMGSTAGSAMIYLCYQ